MSKLSFSANFIEYKGDKVGTYNQVIANATSTDKYVSAKALNETIDALLQNIFPVGYILTTFNEQDYSDYLGMTWEKLDNTFLYADGRYSVGDFGGEEKHVLTEREMPIHSHDGIVTDHLKNTHRMTYGNAAGRNSGSAAFWQVEATTTHNERTAYTVTSGGGLEHNNMPPFTVVRMWQRIS